MAESIQSAIPSHAKQLLSFTGKIGDSADNDQRTQDLSSLLVAIVESSDDAIISSTLDGTITSWNQGAERIFGYTAEEAVGQSTSLLASSDAEEDPALVLDYIRRGERIDHYETLRRHKDGSDIVVSLTVSPVRDSSSKLIGFSKVARDITSSRRAEQSLRNADKLALAGRMAASIAHEINNPLEAITNLLYLLQQETLSPPGRAYLELAQHELMRVSHIASQTLGFFRGTSEPIHCQLSEIVDSAISLHAGRLLVSNISVETKYLPAAPLLCQEGELRQVLANFVSNSLDSITSRGRLLLRVRPATDTLSNALGIRLTIADTGSGMSPKTRRQLFEPFYTTKGSTGTGLGLWVSQQIVARHKGRISIRTRQSRDFHGTVFSLFFPYLDHLRSERSPGEQMTYRKWASGNDRSTAISPEDESRRTLSQSDSPSTAYNAA